jgi:hypothetical protein
MLLVPPLDDEPWPTLGPQVCDFLEERSVFGPGSLKGELYQLTDDWRAAIYSAYEVYPRGHRWAGRRRYKRVGLSVRKGLAKTEVAAQVAYAELHPEAPVRVDGWRREGRAWVPVGRPVRDPYIPLLAVTVEQVEELAFGALYVLCSEGPDADLFDVTLERILRLDERGRADGKAVPLANSPGARDGARTTFQVFDEPHRLVLPRQLAAHETMVANLEKRVLEDPWGLYVGTAGELGEDSVAEGLHEEAQKIERGEIDDPQLFYLHRDAGAVHEGDGNLGHDLSTLEGRIAAVAEATGPTGEFGPGQFHSIAKQWDRPKADKRYLQRVWLNLWVKSGAQAFDPHRWAELKTADPIPDGSFIVAGFDGARFRDSTGIVITDIASGRQQNWATWERPVDSEGRDVDDWEVPEVEVTAAWAELVRRFDLWIAYCDPPHWTETVGSWAARWPDQFEEWWTSRLAEMARAVRAYREAILSGAVTHVHRDGNELDAAFDKHIAAAGRKDIKLWEKDDETGQEVRLFVLQKLHPDRKFDVAMAGCLSWKARLDALRKNAKPRRKEMFVPVRIR